MIRHPKITYGYDSDNAITSGTIDITGMPAWSVVQGTTATASWTTTLTQSSDTWWLDNSPTKFLTPQALDGARRALVSYPEPPRRPPPREFNRYINASDLLEEFIRWVGEQGASKEELLAMPMEFFVKWIILKACEDEGPDVPKLALPQARCIGCQRFMRRAPVPFHGPKCAAYYYRRAA